MKSVSPGIIPLIALGWFVMAASPLFAGNVLQFAGARIEGVDGETSLNEITSGKFSPDGLFYYSVSATESAITVYSRNVSTGILTRVQKVDAGETGFPTLPDFIKMIAISPDGKNIYAAAGDRGSAGDDTLIVFTRNAVSGELTILETFVDQVGGVTGMDHPRGVLVSPDGEHVYVGSVGDSTIVLFSRNTGSGALTFESEQNPSGVLSSGNPRGMTMSGDGKYLYVMKQGGADIEILERDAADGTLSHVDTVEGDVDTPVGALVKPRESTLSPDENFLYVANGDGYDVPCFARDSATGLLTYVSNTSLTNPGNDEGIAQVAATPDGNFLIVPNYNDENDVSDVHVFLRNKTTGALTLFQVISGAEGSAPFTSGSTGVSISPDGKHCCILAFEDNAVSVFAIGFSTDVRIGTRKKPSTHKGDDKYSGSGKGQSISIKKPGRARYFVSVENDGGQTDAIRFKIRGLSLRKFRVTVFKLTEGRKNVTAKVLKSGFKTPYSPGEVHNFQILVQPVGSASRAKAKNQGKGSSRRDTGIAKLRL